MAINPLQLPQAPPINSLADFSPLERLVQNWQIRQQEAQQNEQAYRDLGGGQDQPQQGGFLSDLGRKFGILPEAAPPQVAAVPSPRQASGETGSGIGTMTPNAKSWFDYAIRPVADGGLGLTQAQAAGKVANLQAESTPNITPWGVSGDAGTAQGAAQWRRDRLRNLVGFSQAKGLDYKTTEAQQAFMRHEYLGNDPQIGNQYGGASEGRAYGALTATNTPERAAAAVDQYYERSSGEHRGRRVAGATRIAQAAGAQHADPNASPLDNMAYPYGNVGAPSSTDVSAQARTAPPPLEERAVPAAPVVASDAPEARAVQNLTSGQPAAAAGLDRETLARMYRNPATRPLATALLQKAMDPGSWSYHKAEDGSLIGANSRTGQVKVVVPNTDSSKEFSIEKRVRPDGTEELVRVRKVGPEGPIGGGDSGGAGSKEEREVQNYFKVGKSQGLTDEQARAYALNKGKMPKEDRSATEIHELKKAEDSLFAAQAARRALDKASDLSKKAFQGAGASQIGSVFANLPSWVPGHEAGVATGVLANTQIHSAMTQLQDAFGRNPSDREGQMMIKLQGAVNEPLEVRNQIIEEAKEVFDERVAKNKRQYDQMYSGEYFKKGGAALPSKPAPTSDIKWSIVK